MILPKGFPVKPPEQGKKTTIGLFRAEVIEGQKVLQVFCFVIK